MSTGDAPPDPVGVATAAGAATASSASPPAGPDTTVEVVVGRVAKAHGLRGDVLVDVRTDEPARRFTVGARLHTARGDLTVASMAWHGTRLLTRFEEVDGRDAAEALRGAELCLDVLADERPDDPEEFYDHQLIGLLVIDVEGRPVGTVSAVTHQPAQDVLSVRNDGGESAGAETGEGAGAETLVPFVRELVPTVDLAAGRIVLARPVESLSVDAGLVAPEASATDEPPRH